MRQPGPGQNRRLQDNTALVTGAASVIRRAGGSMITIASLDARQPAVDGGASTTRSPGLPGAPTRLAGEGA